MAVKLPSKWCLAASSILLASCSPLQSYTRTTEESVGLRALAGLVGSTSLYLGPSILLSLRKSETGLLMAVSISSGLFVGPLINEYLQSGLNILAAALIILAELPAPAKAVSTLSMASTINKFTGMAIIHGFAKGLVLSLIQLLLYYIYSLVWHNHPKWTLAVPYSALTIGAICMFIVTQRSIASSREESKDELHKPPLFRDVDAALALGATGSVVSGMALLGACADDKMNFIIMASAAYMVGVFVFISLAVLELNVTQPEIFSDVYPRALETFVCFSSAALMYWVNAMVCDTVIMLFFLLPWVYICYIVGTSVLLGRVTSGLQLEHEHELQGHELQELP